MDDNNGTQGDSSNTAQDHTETALETILSNLTLQTDNHVVPATRPNTLPGSASPTPRMLRIIPHHSDTSAVTPVSFRDVPEVDNSGDASRHLYINADRSIALITDHTRSLRRQYRELRSRQRQAARTLADTGSNQATTSSTQSSQDDTTQGINDRPTETHTVGSTSASGDASSTRAQAPITGPVPRPITTTHQFRRQHGSIASEARSTENQTQAAADRLVQVPSSEGRNAANPSDGLPSSSVPSSTSVPNNPNSIVERTTSARRDLDRALRDYRIARRALRNHHNTEPVTPADNSRLPSVRELLQVAGNGDDSSPAESNTQANTSAPSGFPTTPERDGGNVADLIQPTSYTSFATAMMENGIRVPASGMAEQPRTPRGQTDITRELLTSRLDADGMITYDTPRLDNGRLRMWFNNTGRSGDTTPPEGQMQDRVPLTTLIFAEKMKAKSMLKYLAVIRKLSNDRRQALETAKDLGLENIARYLTETIGVEIPMHIEQLPTVEHSSWIDSGMSWNGSQKVKNGSSRTRHNAPSATNGSAGVPRPMFDRFWRQDEQQDRLRADRMDRARDGNAPNLVSPPRHEPDTISMSLSREEALSIQEIFQDLSSVLIIEQQQREWVQGDADLERSFDDESASIRMRTSSTRREPAAMEDEWPVDIRLHEVNWQDKKVYGTMTAKYIPHHVPHIMPSMSDPTPRQPDKATSAMETFFDGEIVDLRTHELQTSLHKAGYGSGGLDTDIRHWSLIGPFRRQIDQAFIAAAELKTSGGRSQSSATLNGSDNVLGDGTSAEQVEPSAVRDAISIIGADEMQRVIYQTMARCIGSKEWLDATVGEGGWILMRWKERCFVSPPITTLTSVNANGQTETRTITHQSTTLDDPTQPPSTNFWSRRYRTSVFDQNYTTTYAVSPASSSPFDSYINGQGAWGLTISGFYYVALHRMTGKIEAVYCDAGSQPYQLLNMKPADFSHDGQEHAEREGEDNGVAGVRKEFGIIQLR